MTDHYWQVIRRVPAGEHQSISDHFTAASAYSRAQEMNNDYQSTDYAVIHRTTTKLLDKVSRWWDGRKWHEEIK